MELCVIHAAEWIKEPRDVLPSAGMVLFHVLRASAETMLRTVRAIGPWSLGLHAAPPESDR